MSERRRADVVASPALPTLAVLLATATTTGATAASGQVAAAVLVAVIGLVVAAVVLRMSPDVVAYCDEQSVVIRLSRRAKEEVWPLNAITHVDVMTAARGADSVLLTASDGRALALPVTARRTLRCAARVLLGPGSRAEVTPRARRFLERITRTS